MAQDAKTLKDRYLPKQTKVLKLDRQMNMVRFSPCGKVLAAAGQDGSIRRWDASTDALAELPPLLGHHGWVQALAFHPDGRRLFSADSWGQLRAWPYLEREAKPLWSVDAAHDGWIRGLSLDAAGKLLATCGRDGAVRTWSADDGTRRQELGDRADDIFSIAFHPDGKSLVSGDVKGNVRIWDVSTGKIARTIDAKVLYRIDRLQDVGGVRCLAFDRSGATIACGGTLVQSGGNVQGTPAILMFDFATGKLKHTIKVGTNGDGFVYDALLHADGFVMAVTSGNPGSGKLFFHNPPDAQPFFLATNMANCHSLAVHPAGRRLAVSATNGGSNGNGRVIGKNKDYPGNFSPVHIFDMA